MTIGIQYSSFDRQTGDFDPLLNGFREFKISKSWSKMSKKSEVALEPWKAGMIKSSLQKSNAWATDLKIVWAAYLTCKEKHFGQNN